MRNNFRFCALVLLVVSLCGCPRDKLPPPPPGPPVVPQITLEIQQSSTPQSGYTTTYGSNAKMYIYRYSGGTKHGNVSVTHGQGEANVLIKLSASPNFVINAIPITDDPNNQLIPHVEPNGLNAQIRDTNTDLLDAYYAVKVLDDSATPPAENYCDPRIVNN
jgi:hypothetical protein